jgi:hypothetical protein
MDSTARSNHDLACGVNLGRRIGLGASAYGARSALTGHIGDGIIPAPCVKGNCRLCFLAWPIGSAGPRFSLTPEGGRSSYALIRAIALLLRLQSPASPLFAVNPGGAGAMAMIGGCSPADLVVEGAHECQ